MSARILDGKRVAAVLRGEAAEAAARWCAETGLRPHLVVVLASDDPASAVYVRSKQAACEKSGINSTLRRLPASVTQADLLAMLGELGADPAVHGILVQLPLSPAIDERAVLHAVNPAKDVDCLHPVNVGLLAEGQPRFRPCTPAGIQELLAREGIEVAGQHVVIVGRSNLVGKPLATMLVQKGIDATVTVCHSRTRDLAEHTRRADILVAALGCPERITADMINPGAVIVDVGINRLADGRLVGDVAFASVKERAAAITPVPGGIGPMTVAMLLHNTLRAARLALSPNGA